MSRPAPPDHRDPDAFAGLRRRQQRAAREAEERVTGLHLELVGERATAEEVAEAMGEKVGEIKMVLSGAQRLGLVSYSSERRGESIVALYHLTDDGRTRLRREAAAGLETR